MSKYEKKEQASTKPDKKGFIQKLKEKRKEKVDAESLTLLTKTIATIAGYDLKTKYESVKKIKRDLKKLKEYEIIDEPPSALEAGNLETDCIAHKAARTLNPAVLKSLQKKRGRIGFTKLNDNGQTIFHAAVETLCAAPQKLDDTKTAELIQQALESIIKTVGKEAIPAEDKDFKTALHYVCEKADVRVIKFVLGTLEKVFPGMLYEYTIDHVTKNPKAPDYKTPHEILYERFPAEFQELGQPKREVVEKKAKQKQDREELIQGYRDFIKQSPLDEDVTNIERIKALKLLLNQVAEDGLINHQFEDGNSFLHIVAPYGQEIIDHMLELEADPKLRNQKGQPALHTLLESYQNNKALNKALIRAAEIDVGNKNPGQVLVAKNEETERLATARAVSLRFAIRLLVEKSPDMLAVEDASGRIPLHYAIEMGFFEIADIIYKQKPELLDHKSTKGLPTPRELAQTKSDQATQDAAATLFQEWFSKIKLEESEKALTLQLQSNIAKTRNAFRNSVVIDKEGKENPAGGKEEAASGTASGASSMDSLSDFQLHDENSKPIATETPLTTRAKRASVTVVSAPATAVKASSVTQPAAKQQESGGQQT